MPLVLPAKMAQRHGFDLAVRGFGDLCLHGVFKGDGDGGWAARNRFGSGRLWRFRFRVVEVDAALQQQRFVPLRAVQAPFPIIALVEACQPGVQDDLRGETRFDITGEDGAVARPAA